MQVIGEMFANEVRERETELLANAQADEERYRRRCGEQRFDDEGQLPVVYCDRGDPPVSRPISNHQLHSGVLRRANVLHNEEGGRDPDAAVCHSGCSISYDAKHSQGRGGMLLLLCNDTKKRQFGTLAKLRDTELGNSAEDNHMPFTVHASGVERVESVGPAISSGHGWCTSQYRIVRDDFIFPDSQEQNESAALGRLQHAIAQKSVARESLVPEFTAAKELAGKDLTDLDRYCLCCQLLHICTIVARRQLQDCSAEAQHLFASNFSNIMVVGEDPTSEEVENASMFYARLVVASSDKKWRWYTMRGRWSLHVLHVARLGLNALQNRSRVCLK
ncbi:hypothetical protein, conserved [Babesia ovata]|uniref:Uncharacterized protein n=1 Tax=Babesia ovata TaxID=189622 RepID=A0A2H6KG20_9APIC|nr:uncharacterized protein BOVATA_034330 [Babesia ovata]GBE61940.1 hypothetical protein, conserved [Babesia ovata]